MEIICGLVLINSQVIKMALQMVLNILEIVQLALNIYLLSYFYKMSQFFIRVLSRVSRAGIARANCLIMIVVLVICLQFV